MISGAGSGGARPGGFPDDASGGDPRGGESRIFEGRAARRSGGRGPGSRSSFYLRLALGIVLVLAIAWGARSCTSRRAIVPGGDFSLLVVIADGPVARIDIDGGRMRMVVRSGEPSAARAAVEAVAGQRIGTVFDLELTADDIGRIIDALGGVLVNVPETIEYRVEGGMPIRIEAGMRRLDADRVRRYLERPDGARAASLRAVAMGVGARVGELEGQGVEISRILSAALAGEDLGTDGRHPQRLAGLLRAARGLGPTDVAIDVGDAAAAAGPNSSTAAVPGGTAAAPGGTAAATGGQGSERMTRPVRLRILNGTGRPGLAARAAARFPAGRFEVVETANADRFGYARTEVRGQEALVRDVIDVMGLGRAASAAMRPGADVEIVLGADARGL